MTTPPSPRIFLIRHGETDWVLGGKHNSQIEVPLSRDGEEDVRLMRKMLVGVDKMIDPQGVAKIYCSPRLSTRRTAEIIGLGVQCNQNFYDCDSQNFINDPDVHKQERSILVTSMLQEWDYGEYEGLTLADIHRERMRKGLDKEWDIWEDGCPGGESPKDVSDRLDKLICEIKEFFLRISYVQPNGQIIGPSIGLARVAKQDIVCIAHDHILAALALRWTRQPLTTGHMRLIIQPGGVVVLV